MITIKLTAKIALLFLIAAAVTLAGGLLRTASAAIAVTATVGQAAPNFNLPNAKTGAQTTLASLMKGKKAAVIMFIATQCPISNAYNERMVALAQKYSAHGVAFVGINANQTEPTAEVVAHAAQHKFPFPVLKDGNDAVADVYNAHVTPETYIIDSKGVLVYHGRIDNSTDESEVQSHDLANALDEVLAGKPVTKPITKAFGCSIKRG